MLRRGFNNGSRARAACRLPTAASTLARVPAARQVTSRRLFANAGATPPPSSGGGVAFGVLVGAAVGASAWTGYRYYTDPPFRTRLNDFWASLSSSSTAASTSSPSRPTSTAASPKPSVTREQQEQEQEQEQEGAGAPLLAAQVLLAAAEEATALDAQEEAVVALPDSLVVHHHHQQQQHEQQQHEREQEDEEVGQQVGSAATQSHGGEGGRAEEAAEEDTKQPATIIAPAPLVVVEVVEEEEVAHVAPEEAKTADVPAAVVALVTESFAASDAHQEAVAAVAHDDHHHHDHRDKASPAEQQQQQQQDLAANPAEPAAEQRGHEGEQQQEQQHAVQQEQQQEQAAAEGATRLQELQAIKEIIAIQAESCERQVREKVERLRQKYEHKMAALRQHMDEVVAEHVDVERQKISDDYQNRLHQQLDTLQHQFVEERQRLYSEMEDVVAGLNARFVELVREEKQLLNEQLEESARLHAHTLAYLQTLVDDAQYRIRHLSEEREWWSWTERLASAVRGLESAALGPEGHLASFQAELDLVRSLAATRPLYKAVAHHIEAQASRGVYSVGRLRERFEQVEKHVRVAAQVPEGGGLLRHAVAPLLAATVSLNPYHAPTPQELLLDSARRHLFDDDLLTALRDMEQLTGLAHELAHDWIEEARKRLVVEQAISVIAADVTTLKPPTDL